MRAALLALALLAAAPAQATTQAEANAALRADPEIWSGLMALAIAREVADRCPTLAPRTFRGHSFVFGLYNRARDLGYPRAQIMAFIDDEAEKAHLRREVTAWFATRNLREGSDPQEFCAAGAAEMAGQTLAGSFLRAE